MDTKMTYAQTLNADKRFPRLMKREEMPMHSLSREQRWRAFLDVAEKLDLRKDEEKYKLLRKYVLGF